MAINYVRGGRGPTLVLLHGYPQCWRMWRALLPELAATYHVIAPDLRGFGDSDAPPDGYDKLTVAADLHGLLTSLGLAGDIRLVGHDLGTRVAYAYAAAHPDTVSRLVLTEAPIPDESIYAFPALSTARAGGVELRLLQRHQRPAGGEMVAGRECTLGGPLHRFDHGDKGSIGPADIEEYARHLTDPAHLRPASTTSGPSRRTSRTTRRTGRTRCRCRCWPSARRPASAGRSPTRYAATPARSTGGW